MTEFRVNQNLIESIQNFNQLKGELADALLNRVFQNPNQSFNEMFSFQEREKLLKKSGFEEEQTLKNIVNAFSFVLIQAIADRNFPNVEKALKENGLSEIHSKILNDNWCKYSNDLQIKMREQPVAVQEQLKDFNWSIQIPTNDSKLPLKKAAQIKEVDSRIDNNDELFSIDARNPNEQKYKQQQDDCKKEKIICSDIKINKEGILDEILTVNTDRKIKLINKEKELEFEFQHRSRIWSIKYIPFENFNQAISCDDDGEICIWDCQNGKLIQKIRQQDYVKTIEFDENSKQIFTGGQEGIKIWKKSQQSEIFYLADHLQFNQGYDFLNSMTLLKNQENILGIAAGYSEGEIIYWKKNIISEKYEKQLLIPQHSDRVQRIFQIDQENFFSQSDNGQKFHWNINSSFEVVLISKMELK